MSKIRVIARIDIKNEYVIKGIQFDGLRKLGNPNKFAKKYYDQGIDEIFLMDAVASLYDRNNLSHIINEACKEVFVPITVGGGIRNLDDIKSALHAGASKVAINTQAIKNPEFITKAAAIFGSQCIVGSIEAKRNKGSWEAYIDNGRERTGKDAIEWAKTLQALGAGEVMITSVDKEGTKTGFDIELIKELSGIKIPLVISGGVGNHSHIEEVCKSCSFDGVAVGTVLHYDLMNVYDIKKVMNSAGLRVRSCL